MGVKIKNLPLIFLTAEHLQIKLKKIKKIKIKLKMNMVFSLGGSMMCPDDIDDNYIDKFSR